jgi:hypothetical protein
MITCRDYRKAVLDLMERCAPSGGIFNVHTWEALGRPSVTSPDFVCPPRQEQDWLACFNLSSIRHANQ